jgi:hypothetical protein
MNEMSVVPTLLKLIVYYKAFPAFFLGGLYAVILPEVDSSHYGTNHIVSVAIL